jgi:hypothetical protein
MLKEQLPYDNRPRHSQIDLLISKEARGQLTFLAATNKLEAVVRISNLTNSGPEVLGPGSKEHKSVLINLAVGLGIPFSHDFTKQELAAHLAATFGKTWEPEYESVGQTITLKGLNLLLEAATEVTEKSKDPFNQDTTDSFSDELSAISKVVTANTPLVMDGKICVQEMQELEDANWKQVQWQGFYFEMKAVNALTSELGGGRRKLFNTSFDYVRNFIWDLKAHSSENEGGSSTSSCILNDSRAIELAAGQSGVGFVILSGKPTYDREFTKWHKEFRGGGEEEPRRTLKSSFQSESLDIFFVPTVQRLERAVAIGEMSINAQGKNSNGKPRPPKYGIDLNRAKGSDIQVFSHSFI